MPRTRGNLLAILSLFDVENEPKWQRRDVTGDGKPETFCNQAVHAACEVLEAPIPLKLANDYATWFPGEEGQQAGWVACNSVQAAEFAEMGFPTVGVLAAVGHGHIVMAVPAIDGSGLHTWQAGRTNHENRPANFSWRLSDLPRVKWYTHA